MGEGREKAERKRKDPGRLAGKARCHRAVILTPRKLRQEKCCDF